MNIGDLVAFEGQRWIIGECDNSWAEKLCTVQRIDEPVYLLAENGEGGWTWAPRAELQAV